MTNDNIYPPSVAYSVYLGGDLQNFDTSSIPFRVEEGRFKGTIYSYDAIRIAEENQLSYTPVVHVLKVDGSVIDFSAFDSEANLDDVLGYDAALDFYNNVTSPILYHCICDAVKNNTIDQIFGDQNGKTQKA